MSQPNLVAPPKFEKRENGYVYVSYLGHSPQLLNSVETYLYSQVETLKAQLANVEANLRTAEGNWELALDDRDQEIVRRRKSEAQVRELREAANKAFEEVNKTAQEYSLVGMSGGPKALALDQQRIGAKRVLDAIEAALRSAPPSGPKLSEWDFDIPRDNRFHDWPIAETNAGEERQDLAQVPAARLTRSCPSLNTAGRDDSPLPVHDGDSASTQSGPQDSPSRSEWKFVGDDELTNHFRRTHCLSDLTPEAWQTVANCLLRNFRVIKAAPPSPACNSMQDNKLATDLKSEPICPAREKEKAE